MTHDPLEGPDYSVFTCFQGQKYLECRIRLYVLI